MIIVQVENLEEVAARISHIPGAAQKALKTAGRKTLKAAKKDAIEKVKARYTSPTNLFTKSLKIRTTSTGGKLISRGAKNALDKFQNAPSGRITAKGVYIRSTVVRGQGGILPTGFRKSSGAAIFERVGQSRFPIKKLYSVAAPSMINVAQVREPVLQKIEQKFPQEFVSAVENFL